MDMDSYRPARPQPCSVSLAVQGAVEGGFILSELRSWKGSAVPFNFTNHLFHPTLVRYFFAPAFDLCCPLSLDVQIGRSYFEAFVEHVSV